MHELIIFMDYVRILLLLQCPYVKCCCVILEDAVISAGTRGYILVSLMYS